MYFTLYFTASCFPTAVFTSLVLITFIARKNVSQETGNPQPDQVGLVCHQDGRPSSQAGAGHQAGEQPLRLK